MDTKAKLEQVLELMINEESEQAQELLHSIFVDESRRIYADLINEDEEVEEAIDAGDKEEDFLNDIETAENEIEAEEMYSEDDEEDMGDDMDAAEDDLADEMMGDDEGEDEAEGEEEMPAEVEDAFVSVTDGLDELKAAFAELLDNADDADEEGEEEMDMDMEEPAMGDMEMEMPMESEEQLEEAEEFGKAVSADNADTAQSKDSLHTKKMKSDVELEGKPVDFSGTGEEKKVALPKDEMKTDKKNAAELRNVKG